MQAQIPLYPLRFKPQYQYRLWGGRRLSHFYSELPGDGPIGEAWILSDRDDHPGLISEGPLEGTTIQTLLRNSPEQLLGRVSGHFQRFPLLLKLLDVRGSLSVQVHPDDETAFVAPGSTGKSEAWVVLEAGSAARVYAGLKATATPEILRESIARGSVVDQLASFTPKRGDGILVRAGTVHSLTDAVVFEVQQNSDVTFRLYDWDHIDPTTGRPRALQVDDAMACIDFAQGAVHPSTPIIEETVPTRRERIVACEYFAVTRISGNVPFTVGAAGVPRVLVCIAGVGHLDSAGSHYALTDGDVLLLPATIGACLCLPEGVLTVLEISLPQSS